MSGKQKKKERTSNYSPEELNMLLKLCNAASDIIENKKTDNVTNSRKAAQWNCIEKQFNMSSNGPFRSAKSLRFKYDNYKKRKKQMKLSKDTEDEDYKLNHPPDEDDTLLYQDIQEMISQPPQITIVDCTSHSSVKYRTRRNASLAGTSNTTNSTLGLDTEFLSEEQTVDKPEDPKTNDSTSMSRPITPKTKSNKQIKVQPFERLVDMKKKKFEEEIDLIRVQKLQMKEIHSLQVKKLKMEIQLLEMKLCTFPEESL